MEPASRAPRSMSRICSASPISQCGTCWWSSRSGSGRPTSCPGHHRRTSTLSSSPVPVGRVLGRDVGEVEQPGAHPLLGRVGLGRRGPLVLAQPAAPGAAAPRPAASSPAFLACPTWRESSFTSARTLGARAAGPGTPRRPRARRPPRPPRRRAGPARPSPRRDRHAAPGYRSFLLKVACDAVPAVEVTGLTVRYGPAGTPPAVDDLHLSAEAGEVLVVLGPNGAGKTSTVETLEGYRRPAAGDGARPRAATRSPTTPRSRGRIGVMLQRGGVYPMLGPRRVLDLFAGYYPDPVPTGRAARPRRAARRRRHALAPPLGRRAAAPLARPGPGRAARGGLPRRADGRRRPRGPHRRPRRGGRPEGARASASCSPPTSWARPRRWPTAS